MKAHARNSDPQTSLWAAESVKNMTQVHQSILTVLKTDGPRCDEELTTMLGYLASPSGIRSRRSELVRMGKVRDSGLLQRTKSGRKTIVWEAV